MEGKTQRICLIHTYPNAFTIRSLSNRGYKVVLVHPDPTRGEAFPELDDQIVINLSDDAEVITAIAAYHREKPFDLIFPGQDETNLTVAKVAHYLSLPCNPVATAQAGLDKCLAASLWQIAGIPTPRTLSIPELETGHQIIDSELGWPVILKTADSSDAHQAIELRDANHYHEQIQLLSHQLDEDQRQEMRFLAQEYCPGPEIRVDLLYTAKAVQVISIFELEHRADPHIHEVAAFFPPVSLAKEQMQEIGTLAKRAVRALGAECGAAQVTIRIHPEQGPLVIDAGLCPGEGQMVALMEYLTGFNLHHTLCEVMLERVTLEQAIPAPRAACLYGGIAYPHHGKVTHISGLEVLDRIDGLLQHVVHPDQDGSPHILGYTIVGSTREAVLEQHQLLQQNIALEVTETERLPQLALTT